MRASALVSEYPLRDPDLTIRLLPDGHVVLHSKRTNRAYTLTPLAGLVWEFCDGTNNLDDILQRLKNVDQVAEGSNLKSEVETLLADFDESGLILPQE
ncbi:MAG TPA: PqqD family protein [Planktothrix sp.]|jgi:hypothetical protein